MSEAPRARSTQDETLPPAGDGALPTPEGDPGEWPRVPGYELLAEIGRGGMGIVFKARQLPLNRIVAVKIIRKDRLSHPDAIRRFRREVQAAARLTHPNLVTVYDADEAGDLHFFSMQFIDGINLQRLVQESGPMPVRLACHLLRQAALGLQHAYEQGMVHRDVKPANLIASPRPDYGQPVEGIELRILDLGLVRLRQPLGSDEGSNSALTEPGALLGTVDFVAPEQARDPRAADIRADLYSLGCTLYFLLTGQVPYPGGTVLDKLDRHRWETPPRVERLRQDAPPALGALLQRLLAKRPEERCQTPIELAAALETFSGTVEARGAALPATATGGAGDTIDLPQPPSTDLQSDVEYQRLKGLLAEELARGGFAHARTLVGAMLALRPNDWDALTARAAIERYAGDANAEEWARFTGHADAVTCMALSPDDRWLATGSLDATIRTWDLSSYRQTACCAGHGGAITSLAFIQRGRWLLSAAADRTLRGWDPMTGREAFQFAGHVARINHLAISPDETHLLTACGHAQSRKENVLRLWDVATRKEVRTFKGHQGKVNCGAFSPDGRVLASGCEDGTIRLWDAATGKCTETFQGHVGAITGVAFTPDGRHLLYAGETARLLDLTDQGETCLLFQDGDDVLDVAISGDGLRFVAGHADGGVRLWDLASGRVGRQQQQRLLGVETVVRLWEAAAGGKPRVFTGHDAPVLCVAYARGGLFVASGSADKTARLWKIPTE